MGRIFTTLLLVLALGSCSTHYYYAQIESGDPYVEKDEKNNLVFSGDSLMLIYSFHGENAPVKITVDNKMSRKLYVNWDSSWFAFGDNPENSVSLGQYITDNETITQVNAADRQEKTLFELSDLPLNEIESKNVKKEKVILTNGETRNLKTHYFNEDDTPLYLFSHIEIHLDSVNCAPVVFEQDFYLKKVIQGGPINPKKMAAVNEKQGNLFFVREEKGRGFVNVLGTAGVVALVAADLLLEISGND